MADAILEIVVDNLKTFVEGKLASFWGVEAQIQKLTSNLTTIRAVLQDAEEKQFTSHAVKDWLHKLSDAAYVLDDILDECSIQGGVSEAHSTCLARFNPKTVLFRFDVADRMKAIAQRFKEIDDERRTFELREGVVVRRAEDEKWRQTTSVISEDQVFGRDQDREKIIDFLLGHASRSEELSIYPIVGMGGLGKTTLARWVFNHDRVKQHFEPLIWVCVSNDFSLTRILQSIVESITGQNPNLSTLQSMQKKVQELLVGKMYLLVLDDVWNEDKQEWEVLKSVLSCGGARTQGASVLVTTRKLSVAAIMGTCPYHDLLPLSEDDTYTLFKHHAFGPNSKEREELVELGKAIAGRCGGSPLGAVMLGSLLHDKSEESQWLEIKNSKLWEIPEIDDIMRALRISYVNLKLSLRRCFSFCAIYPQDRPISKEELIHLWMANGLIQSRRNMEVEDVGNEAWNEICRRSFFQEVETDSLGNTTFKMHDLIHELAQSTMGEECKVLDSTNVTNFSSRLHHVSFVDFHELLNLNMSAFKKVESLRTLFIIYSFDDPVGELKSRSLRVLSIPSSQLSSLKNLTHLRYLNISGGSFTMLPKSVSSLQKLQTLKLEYCWDLSCLPNHLTQLKNLRHIKIENCPRLVAMPQKLGELKCLKTLSVFIVESMAGYGLDELGDLQLGGKLHIKGLENVQSEGDARRANMKSKKDLNRLYLSWGNNANSESERTLEALEPHASLKSFGMKGYKGIKLPSWMKNTSILSSLACVVLCDCKNCWELPPLGKLPHLEKLYISGMEHMKHIDEDSYDGVEEKAFKSLKELTLSRLPELERMLKDERVEMLPLLSKLTISSVPKLKLPNLPSVEDLHIQGFEWGPDDDGNVDILKSMHHVKKLEIERLPKVKELPHELGRLSLLEELRIVDCEELESVAENVVQGLTSLKDLHLIGCEKLVILPDNLNKLASLRRVDIARQKIPEGLQNIPSLQNLSLWFVESLPEWLGDITSLQELDIEFCPELSSLPTSFRQLTNLKELFISDCPKLEKRCQRGTGEDWQYIAHVPDFTFLLEPLEEDTICERIRSIWKTLRKRPISNYHHDEFDEMVDDL